MIGERLPETMGTSLYLDTQFLVDGLLQDALYRVDVHWLGGITPVGVACKKIIIEVNWDVAFHEILEVEVGSIHDSVIDIGRSVLARLLLDQGHALSIRLTVGGEEMTNLDLQQVTTSESEVDAHGEEQVISVPAMADHVILDADDVVQTLDGFGSVLLPPGGRILEGRTCQSHTGWTGNALWGVVRSGEVDNHSRVLSGRMASLELDYSIPYGVRFVKYFC